MKISASILATLSLGVVIMMAGQTHGMAEFATIGCQKVLLFAMRAGSGKSPLQEYRRDGPDAGMPRDSRIPALFRSAMVKDFAKAAAAASANYIIVEMRRKGRPVAGASFAIQDLAKLDTENWFNADVVRDTFPFDFRDGRYDLNASFSNGKTAKGAQRTFFVYNPEGIDDCNAASGLMGVAESPNDPCGWARGGTRGLRPPVFFYQKSAGRFRGNTGYADQLLIYFMNQNLYGNTEASQYC